MYRSLELPLPKQLPYASKEMRKAWTELLARIMPFDLVIDEHTADGQEARVSKSSVAGSWGAVAGNLRYFADRFGVPRAGIEGTTIPYDLVRRYAALGAPRVVLGGSENTRGWRSSGGSPISASSSKPRSSRSTANSRGAAAGGARRAGRRAVAGETVHPDQARLRRALGDAGQLWRRSGGTLPEISPERIRARIRAQLEG